MPFKHYTINDGLPYNAIKRIIQDSKGFIWFCTGLGISRFDGYRFTNYGLDEGLPDPSINDMIETRAGQYWVATNGGGVCRFNVERRSTGRATKPGEIPGDRALFTVYTMGDVPATSRVNVLYEDRRGRIWAGTDGGIFVLDASHGVDRFVHVESGLPPIPDRLLQIFAIVEDDQESLWIGTTEGLIRRSPDGQLMHYAIWLSENRDIVRSLMKDRDGRIWVGHERCVVVLVPQFVSAMPSRGRTLWRQLIIQRRNKKAGRHALTLPDTGEARLYTQADGLAGSQTMALRQMRDGRIWLASADGGLTEFDGSRFSSYTTVNGLSENGLFSLCEDRDGNLWIGGQTTGVMKRLPNGFVTYTQADGLGDKQISYIFETRAGDLCVTGSDWRISRFDGKRFTSTRINIPRHISSISWRTWHAVLEDRTGEWWVSTSDGLYRFPKVGVVEQLMHARPKAVYKARDGLLSNIAARMFEDSRGDIWITTFTPSNEVLARWERATGIFHRYSNKDGLMAYNRPKTFGEDNSGNLWIGFESGGLARYRDGRFTLFTTSDGLPPGGISNIHCDSSGSLWVTISCMGLCHIEDLASDKPRFVTYTRAEGISSIYPVSIAEGEAGKIYVVTSHALDRLDTATGIIKSYTASEGFPQPVLGGCLRDRFGALWYATTRGLTRFIPEPDRPSPPPSIFIERLQIAGVAYAVADLGQIEITDLELSPDQRNIQIDFFGLGPADLRYQFKVEGAGQDWSPPTTQRSVSMNLAPGGYRFLVRAVTTEGILSTSSASVAFEILPPTWRRWWFLTLAAAIVALAIYALHRYRVAQVVELEKVRTRIATDLHDDIGASLSRMAILSEVVRLQIKPDHEKPASLLTEIADSARGLVDSMSDIVWSIDPRKDDLKNIILRARQFAADVLEAQSIDYEIQLPTELEKIKIPPEQRRHLFLIFKEALNNVARHSHCSTVLLKLSVSHNSLLAEIQDDGCGFSSRPSEMLQRNARNGNGLNNMCERASEIGGRLEIKSSPGEGTELVLTVPLKAPRLNRLRKRRA